MSLCCPVCRQNVQQISARNERPPTGGDLVVCLGCGTVCVFTPGLQLQRLTPELSHGYPVALLLEALAVSDAVLARHRRH